MIEKKEGFFSNLFKDKKTSEAEKNNEILKNMLNKKERIISQLQEKVELEVAKRKKADLEAEKRKETEVFLKQSEIIQRNLENKLQRNKELDSQNKELIAELESNKNKIQAITLEKDNILEKYTNLVKILDETQKENTELKENHRSLEEELISLKLLKKQGDQMQIVGDAFLSRDKVEEIQEENSSVKAICGEQRALIDQLEEKNSILEKELSYKNASITDLKDRLERSMSAKIDNIKYRLPFKVLLCSTKFSEFISALEEKDINFVDDAHIEDIQVLTEGIKNNKLAIAKIKNFNSGKYTWDTKTYICKGPRLSKIFSRQRKLLNYFSENYMEFLVDLESFDFDVLLDYKFKDDQIRSFKEKLKEYDQLKI